MLYQEARPRTFSEIVGNESLVSNLESLLSSQDHPHVYLLHGPSGTGKTSIARLIANKVKASGANIVEINASSSRGIDTIRELEEQSSLAPFGDGARVIILDECHSLTTPGQQALLKLLEDIPTYEYFILCSTMPSKLIPTIRNRCAKYETKLLTDEQIKKVIKDSWDRIYTEDLTQDEIDLAAKLANGSAREALIKIEQIAGNLTDDSIKNIQESEVQVRELCSALVNKRDWNLVVTILKKLDNIDYEQARRVIMGYLKACVLNTGNIKRLNGFVLALRSFADSAPLNTDEGPKFVAMLAEAYLHLIG